MAMIQGPAVCVHDLAQARAAVAAAEARGEPLLLISEPGAALFAGCGWWRALMRAACAGARVPCADLLDCGDAAGYALEALRIGQRGLVLDPGTPALAAVRAAAEAAGAVVLTARPVCAGRDG